MSTIKRVSKYAEIQSRQTQILHDIKLGLCTISCGAALNDEAPCHCRCGGYNHGGIWIDLVVVSYEKEFS